MELLSLGAAVLLALVHQAAARLELGGASRSWFLSVAGGASVAYVFVFLLPELIAAQDEIDDATEGLVASIEKHAFVVALLGVTAFYGLEVLARRARGADGAHDRAGSRSRVFWAHVGSYAAYNALIGYLLIERMTASLTALVAFTIAIGLHQFVNDYGLSDHHREEYAHEGRWILTASVLGGWTIGLLVDLPPATIALVLAFVSGAIVLNVLKEELPAYREGRFTAFAVGAGLTTALLLAI
jgi:hypothetical protein